MVRIVIEVCGAALLVWGWCKAWQWKLAVEALAYYIVKKGYTPPNDEEVAECREWVARETAKRIVRSRRA